ncbi:MAG: Trk system potassium transporter TrkA [Clostridia bacterium]|nr:Trk system potassium transporter TrkA [Clostridia bacterium]
MRIMVVGCGSVGHSLAEHLALEGHDVVILDTDDQVISRVEDELDVMCIRGNGANAQTLIDAGVDKTDIMIAATQSDETNMLAGLIARRLGAKWVIARIRDPEYNQSLTLLQRELGIDMVINPERATAMEISRLIRYPFASNIESFAKGRVEMVEFRAQETDEVVGLPLKNFPTRLRTLPRVLYAAVERDGELHIPNGDFIIRAGDRVHVAGDIVSISAFFRHLGRNMNKIRNVMLMGGSRISYYLAKLIAPVGVNVSLIEEKHDHAMYLSEILPDVNVIHGDGTDQSLLEQEGLTQMDAFVTLSDRDEENLMTGLYATKCGVKRVIVKNNRGVYTDLISAMGLDTIVSPKAITCSNILRYVRGRVNGQGTKVEKLYRIMGGKAEALEFIARSGDSYIGIPLKDLNIRKNTLVAVIVHKGKVIVPFGNDRIEAGDTVVIMACERGIRDLNEVISK